MSCFLDTVTATYFPNHSENPLSRYDLPKSHFITHTPPPLIKPCRQSDAAPYLRRPTTPRPPPAAATSIVRTRLT